jgi:DNA-directed RNA polymerase specialized sigma subunit
MSKHPRIRLKTQRLPRYFERGQQLSREEAIRQVRGLLDDTALHPEALRLIDLFQIGAEELSEAGISYEMLKALEQHALLF